MATARPTRRRRFATRTVRSVLARTPTFSSMTASTTASPRTPRPVRSSPPGTPRCARAMSDAWLLPLRRDSVGPVPALAPAPAQLPVVPALLPQERVLLSQERVVLAPLLVRVPGGRAGLLAVVSVQ